MRAMNGDEVKCEREPVESLSAELRALETAVTGIAALEWRRVRLRAAAASLRGVGWLLILFYSLAAAASAAVLVVLGIRDAIGRWAGAHWIGEIGAGMVAGSVLLLAIAAARAAVRRRCRDSLRS